MRKKSCLKKTKHSFQKKLILVLAGSIFLLGLAFAGYRFFEYTQCYGDFSWASGECIFIGDMSDVYDEKPIIYLYPEEITNVTVELGHPENTTHTYPKYQGAWQVQAEPNGDLTDLKTGRHYYALYWEGKNTVSTDTPTEGFVIKGEETIPFLEEKLEQLGLIEREAEEFIIYWLPKLESSPYNFIRFQTLAEQNQNMPLIITPTPKTLIRVMMEYANLDQPIKVKKQTLPKTPKRSGFTVVEWGGTKLNLKGKLK